MNSDSFAQLYDILQQATSQNSKIVSDATKQLEENESKTGFHLALLKIALPTQQNIALNIRWLAVLCLKNGIERHWRPHGTSPICEAEKVSIRNEILSYSSENVQQVALQFAVIVSKIARFDYPRNWPDLINILISSVSNIQTSSMILSDHTVLLTLRYVIKELGSKQLPNDRRVFAEVTSNAFSTCFQVWSKQFKHVAESIQNCTTRNIKQEEVVFSIQKTISILKTFRSMLLVLTEQNFTMLLESLLSSLQTLLSSISCIPASWVDLNSSFHKLLIVHSKILLHSVEMEHPYILKFASQLANLKKQCIFAYSEHKTVFKERFVVNCMNVLKSMLSSNRVYGHAISTEDMQSLMRCLVFSFLPLNEADLENWNCDVEEFCSEEIGETWKYNLRPSAQVLLLTLLHFHSEQLVPVLLSTLHAINESTKNESASINDILISDAVYNAVGLACNELFDHLDFEPWFTDVLLPYVRKWASLPGGKIMHRRILWLIEQWMGAKPMVNIKTTLYDFIVASLDRNLDMAVRLAASNALRQVLDDFEFDIDQFLPYQERSTESLYLLLEDATTGDVKMRVLYVLSFVIERLGPAVSSCVDKLKSILPSIWTASESHNMLRCAVVATLVNVVNGLRGNHESMLSFLTNVIHVCSDISSPAHVYLLADGLDLWLALLYNTSHMTENLLQLFNNIYGLLELSSESLKECLEVIECYVLLGGESFIGGLQGSDLALAMSSLISDVRDECLVMVARLVETMIKIAPSETPFVFQQYLRDTINQVLGENQGTVLATTQLLVVSRLAFVNSAAFWNLFSRESGERTSEATLAFLRVVSERIDSVVETVQRKVVALACLALLTHIDNPDTLQRALAFTLCVCVQVLYDVCDEHHVDTYVTDSGAGDVQPEEGDTHHTLRTRALIRADPNHKLSLPVVTRKTLESLAQKYGGPEVFNRALLDSTGADTLQELREFLQ